MNPQDLPEDHSAGRSLASVKGFNKPLKWGRRVTNPVGRWWSNLRLSLSSDPYCPERFGSHHHEPHLLRPGQPLPEPIRGPTLLSLRKEDIIIVRHPGYDVGFFSIPCFLQPPGAHLGLILDACEIIANNEPGFLGTSKDRTSEILSHDGDLVLSRGNYYYHLENTLNYPIVTKFDAWTPPSELPQHWLDVTIDSNGSTNNLTEPISTSWTVISQKVKDTDVYCAMTRDSSRLNACHLVPKASVRWFMGHRVYLHFDYPAPNINNPQNIITLRTDLKGLGLDQGHSAFVPIKGRLSVYFITKGLPDLVLEFHCRRINLPVRTSLECLYYRFAWSVFELIKIWLPGFSEEVIRVPVPCSVLKRRKGKAERKGSLKGKRTASVDDNCSQSSKLEDVEMEDNVDNASLLSQADDDLEHPLDLCLSYTPKVIPMPMLAAEDARLKKRVGPTLDDSNFHLLSPHDVRRGLYPGFFDVLRLKQRYLLENPRVRATNEAVIGQVNDGYESDGWGWADGESGCDEEEELSRIVSEEDSRLSVDTLAKM
ncbi:hypothetical protein APHAL10511_008702 [Amanita phalloides]|nr:hypothetical protein APHAL10511_008702 [Amanita phalloides]